MDEDYVVLHNPLSQAVLKLLVSYCKCFTKNRRDDYHELAYKLWEQYSSMCIDDTWAQCKPQELANHIMKDSGLQEYIQTHSIFK